LNKKAILLTTFILLTLPLYGIRAQPTHFDVISSAWGTSLNPVEAAPGDLNVPLTISIQYFGYYTATSIRAKLLLPSNFSNALGTEEPTAAAVNVQPNTIFSLTYYLNISPNATIGKHTFTAKIMWNTTWEYNMIEQVNFTVSLNGKVTLNFEPSDIYLSPGQFNTITFKVENLGDGEARNLNINVLSPAQTIVDKPSQTIDKIEPHSKTNVTLNVYVASNLAGQPITITLTGGYRDAYLNQRSFSQNIGFLVNPVEMAMFKISCDKVYLKVGEVNLVKVLLENFGKTPLKNMTLSVSTSQFLSLIEGDGKMFLGTLQPQDKVETLLKIYVSPTSQTSSTITFTVTYYDTSGILKSENRYLTFLLNTTTWVSPISINVNPTTLVAGKLNDIEVLLTNTGDTAIKGLSITFSFPSSQVTWLTPDMFKAEKISPRETVTIKGRAYNPPTATTSTIMQMNIKYYDESGNLYQESRSVGMLSQGIIELKVIDTTILPEKPSPGQIFSITITITNVGTITASSVSALPQLPGGFRMFGSKSVFVGDMQVNVPTTFTLSIQALNTTRPQKYSIPVTVTYYDNLRELHSLNLNLTVDVQEKNVVTSATATRGNALNLSSLILPIVFGLVLFAVGYMIGKRVKR
jgi:uncharacterized repeat protein (TIGR01451 family)